jgi:hypothetical protein
MTARQIALIGVVQNATCIDQALFEFVELHS